MPFIFQYGSNCDADRLNSPDRLARQADDRGRAQTIGEYVLAFDVWSRGNGCAAADLIEATGTGRHAWGVLYYLSDSGLAKLRRIEGSRYEEVGIRVRDKDGKEPEQPVTTFVVKKEARRHGLWTSCEYVQHIVAGLRAHEVPEEYIQHIIDIALQTNERVGDTDTVNTRLLQNLRTRT